MDFKQEILKELNTKIDKQMVEVLFECIPEGKEDLFAALYKNINNRGFTAFDSVVFALVNCNVGHEQKIEKKYFEEEFPNAIRERFGFCYNCIRQYIDTEKLFESADKLCGGQERWETFHHYYKDKKYSDKEIALKLTDYLSFDEVDFAVDYHKLAEDLFTKDVAGAPDLISTNDDVYVMFYRSLKECLPTLTLINHFKEEIVNKHRGFRRPKMSLSDVVVFKSRIRQRIINRARLVFYSYLGTTKPNKYPCFNDLAPCEIYS